MPPGLVVSALLVEPSLCERGFQFGSYGADRRRVRAWCAGLVSEPEAVCFGGHPGICRCGETLARPAPSPVVEKPGLELATYGFTRVGFYRDIGIAVRTGRSVFAGFLVWVRCIRGKMADKFGCLPDF